MDEFKARRARDADRRVMLDGMLVGYVPEIEAPTREGGVFRRFLDGFRYR